MCLHHTVMCCPYGSAIFSTLAHKRHDLKKKILEHKICFDFLYKVCLKHLSFYEELNEILSQMYIGLHVQNLLFLPCGNETRIFSTDFPKILKYQI